MGKKLKTTPEAENLPPSAEIDVFADLDSVDKFLIRKRIEHPGITINELARQVKLHRQTVSERLQKVKVQQAIEELSKNALTVIIDAQNEAARRLVQHMRSGDPDISLRATIAMLKDVLAMPIKLQDRKSEIKRFLDSLTSEDIDAFFESTGDDKKD